VREAAYTPPSGIRMPFLYEDVSRETDKRTTAFQFPGVEGSYVQDNLFSARRYPLRCYFAGPSHDLAATAFELALLERGPGRLEHPFYGSFDAIPFGTITRRDDLKSGANQSVIEVTFWATLLALYPSGQASPRNELLAALDAYDAAGADDYVEQTDLATAAARASTSTQTRSLLRIASDALGAIAGAVTAVDRQFRDAQSALNYGIDVLVGQPLQLAQQVVNLVKAPALATIGVEMRLAGYRDFAERIYAQATTTSTGTSAALAGARLRLRNGFATSTLFASASVAGSIRSALETTYAAKPGALTAADEVLAQFDALIAWHDSGLASLGAIDNGGAQQALRHAAARAAAYLIEASFDLAVERIIVLDRPRSVIDLCAELYGSVDDRLDYLITTNDLSGSEILELPRGASIAYYV
jgi:prophage DNA circulation protein